MIDPNNITTNKLHRIDLEYYLIFWILVAGKNASTTAKVYDKFYHVLKNQLYFGYDFGIFDRIRHTVNRKGESWLSTVLKECGVGCYNMKSKFILELVNSNIDLETCSLYDLMKIKGIGRKTASCFLIHNRGEKHLSALDTHILKFLKDLGYKKIPKSTPVSKRKYDKLEEKFLFVCNKCNREPADLDLLVWRIYSKHKRFKKILIKYCKDKIK